MKNTKGITIVALVITIVILLILAGISIQTIIQTNLFDKTKQAKNATENAEKEQERTLSKYEKELNKYVVEELTDDKINKVLNKNENTFLKDANGNIFTLPAGFKVVVNADTNYAKTVDKGIVIEDATVDDDNNATPTNGSEFVWIPVGKIYTDIEKIDENAQNITLGRYGFDYSTGVETEYSGDSFQEEDKDDIESLNEYGNTSAKSVESFKKVLYLMEDII